MALVVVLAVVLVAVLAVVLVAVLVLLTQRSVELVELEAFV